MRTRQFAAATLVAGALAGCGVRDPNEPQGVGTDASHAADDPSPTWATGVYTEEEFTYDSSIDDAIDNLGGKYAFDDGIASHGPLPVLLVMHGYGGSVAEITEATLRRYASYGFLAVAVGKRGSRDASGREAQDILDALAAV